MQNRIKKLSHAAQAAIEQADDQQTLEAVRLNYLGRKGELTEILKGLKDLSAAEKKEIGQLANQIKNELTAKLSERAIALKGSVLKDLEKREALDVTYPGKKTAIGHLHPLTQTIQAAEDLLISMGFTIEDGPEVEDEFHNFDALNIPANHPARDMWDTFWTQVEGRLLRTHTSPVQVRYMETHEPPFRIAVPGRVFRYENADATHEANFYQLEGLMVDESGKITVANFKSVMEEIMRGLFGAETKVRFRPSYFPFVEPGFEIDVTCPYCSGQGCAICKSTGFIEVVGAGMVNQKVFTAVGYAEGQFEGFAFGFGMDRMAMIKNRIDDIRLFYGGDLRFLQQF